jgi:integrase
MITATPIKTKGIQRKVHIPLAPQLKSQLDRAESLDKSEYVMPGIVERYQRNPDGVVDDFFKILDLESVGLKEVKEAARGKSRRTYSFHSFRHSFASFAANAGIPISTLAAILGDNARTLEKYYVKISDESKTKAIMSMPQLSIGSNTGAVIEVTPISMVEDLKNRIAGAIAAINGAGERVHPDTRMELLKILED